ncbi:hypothetical protein CAPTEDRAFT_200050 [Capitella teleta]|uniref:Alkylated DNA repair protein AlkB homologue 8 N-terminal domain-containing protein n=1 Tax=Capitella teleta TaxID=283909 RepID=R7UGT2_CAPTE|nr:hypothetical protein CAPTEDRAFT_200050 [Capitella teleta]|eukprot:ELU05754.1 hypothetical protein CAPTEDRAFT_200050 [Capitella teleta]
MDRDRHLHRRRNIRLGLDLRESSTFLPSKNKINKPMVHATYDNEYRESSVIILTETWLGDDVPDGSVSLDIFTLFRQDVSAVGTDKCKEADIKIYPKNNPWITKELRTLMANKRNAMKSGDAEAIRRSREDLKEGIEKCKRKHKTKNPIKIKRDDIETCETYVFWIANHQELTLESHIDLTVKKAMTKLYSKRILKRFKLSPRILDVFYQATIVSTLIFGLSIWSAGINESSHRKINQIRKIGRKISQRSKGIYEKVEKLI